LTEHGAVNVINWGNLTKNMMPSSYFASMHNHSFFSLLDATMSPEEIVEQAHKLGFKAVSITEHGNMHSFIRGYKRAKELGIKFIFGCEIYETTDMEYQESDSDRYHLLLHAKSEVGVQNLFKIVSEGATRGFYGKPRVDLKTIAQYSEGITATSACLASRLMRLLVHGFCPCCSIGNHEHQDNCQIPDKFGEVDGKQFERIRHNKEDEIVEFQPKWHEAKAELQKYIDVFGDDFYIEIQSHDTKDQALGNQRILNLAREMKVKHIITFDAHMKDGSEETRDIHRKFVEISQVGREVGETYKDCYQQDIETIYKILAPQIGVPAVEEGIINTGEWADKCNADISIDHDVLMPHAQIPEGYDQPMDYLKHLINVGWKERGVNRFSKEKKKEYQERIMHELDVLEYLDYIGYFLILNQMTMKFKENGIPLGYSRGSGAGSLILWLIGVTEIDSIRWDLDFSRFANKGRKAVADYDMDISKRKRQLALELVEEMFGKENVAHLCTFNSLSPKVAIKDLGKVFDEDKVYDIPYKVRDKMSKLIPDGATIEEALEQSKDLRKYLNKYPKLFHYASSIQNFPKSVGCHASAVIISDTPIVEHAPVMLNKDGRPMMQVEMNNAEKDLKLVKFDFLGLISLDTIDDTLKLAGLTWDDIDLQYLDHSGKLHDEDVLHNIYAKGNTLGVFQMESYVAQNLFKDIQPDSVEDVIAVNAINRPAILSVGMHNNYIKGKHNPSEIKYMNRDVEPIFSKTNGIMLYQEQALSVFRVAGFPDSEVDNARRAIGKKKADEMEKLFADFESGLKARNWREEDIVEMWRLVEAQAEYSFNRSHSVAYGLLSYVMAYLKHHYPVEFMTSLLISEMGDYEQTSKYIDACSKMNIPVLPPNINLAERIYTVIREDNQKKIMFGLESLKGVGEKAVDEILLVRETGKITEEGVVSSGKFNSLGDFMRRCKLDRTSIISLIKAGSFGMDKLEMLEQYADEVYTPTKYVPRKTLPTKKQLIEVGLIEDNDEGSDTFKTKKAELLDKFNETIKLPEWQEKESVRYKKHMMEFKQKYMGNPEMYEFQTLSIFLNGNPFDKYRPIINPFDSYEDGEEKVLLAGTIVNIQRKKQKGGGTYAYIEVLTLDGIYEGMVFKDKYTEYNDLIEKGSNVVMLVKKSGSQFIVSRMRTLDSWRDIADKKLNKLNA
jgi:DNA polymerase III subunit alpha